MLPQDGVGGCTPRPRKLRDDSMSIAPPTPSTAETKTGAIALGRMCLKIIRVSRAPTALEAITKSRSLSVRNSARTRRLTPIQPVMPMIIMMFQMDGSSTAMTARMRNIVGKQSIMSTKRIRTPSTHPP